MTELLSGLVSDLLYSSPPAPSSYRRAAKQVRVTRPRDVQRSRLYKAENAARKVIATQGKSWDLDHNEIVAFVAQVQRSRWWKAQGYRPVTVARDYQGRSWSRGGNGVIRIASDNWHHNAWVVLHEMAHAVLPMAHLHGPLFARTLLGMVGRFLGKEEAAALRAAFVEHRVRHRVTPAGQA